MATRDDRHRLAVWEFRELTMLITGGFDSYPGDELHNGPMAPRLGWLPANYLDLS